MKQFKAFIRKEFYHIFRDPLTMAILFLLPILMLTLFGFAITTEVRNTKIAVYDPSKDAGTMAILNRMEASEFFEITRELSSPDDIESVFRQGRIGLLVVFSERFYENLVHTGEAQIQLLADGSDPNNASVVVNYATAIIAASQQELISRTGGAMPYQITPEVKLLYNPQMKGAYNFVPGVMGMIMMLICAMMTSVSIAREKELGTMEVLLVSPMKPIYVILAKAVPYFFMSVINLTTILLLSVFVLDVPIAGSLFWLIILSLIFIFVSLSLGILISSVVDKQLVALLISGMVLMLPVILLSGMMFPLENMPWLLRALSEIIPAKWFIMAVKKIMIKGLSYSSITRELLILGSMAVVLIAVSLKRFKTRLE
ncbi:MAG: multidrug ABC transporter permease [Bacteroidetes bacterium GWF2_49_14]|nr:MAG: multidrug ABC transporter permease [Bacteroidetes bacterium GWF2_49_14]HBB91203.1 multidrug ABC transporter permease [Bacteroidales bacterium]